MPSGLPSPQSLLAGLAGLVDAGGFVVVLLLGLSLVVATIVLLKLWQFRAARVADSDTPRRAADLYVRGDTRAALELVARSPHPAAQVLRHVIAARSEQRESARTLRESAARLGADSVERLRHYLRPLEVVATLAPLLGLFGTVLGMMEAFRELELAGNEVSPALLSGGIWKALMTTAVGLGVAMPTVVFLNWFERRIERLAHEMEVTVSIVLTTRPGRADEEDDHVTHPVDGTRPVPY